MLHIPSYCLYPWIILADHGVELALQKPQFAMAQRKAVQAQKEAQMQDFH